MKNSDHPDNWRNNVVWFTQQSICFGIVRVFDPILDETKYYIGVGKGYHEKADYERIRSWGAKFPPNAGKVLFNN